MMLCDAFSQTGYYVKQFDGHDSFGFNESKLFCVILNTNLGYNARQLSAMEQDLAWIEAQVLLLHA
jgi:hypothetical protein